MSLCCTNDYGLANMDVPMKNKRVLIWTYELDRGLFKNLREENVDVVVLLQGVSNDVPSFSIYDLFYRTAKLPFDEQASNPIHLSDAFMYRYSDCISRVFFVPKTEDYYCFNIGTVGATMLLIGYNSMLRPYCICCNITLPMRFGFLTSHTWDLITF